MTDDAEYLIVAFGCMSRIGEKVVELAREEGIRLGLLRPITLYPFPKKEIDALVPQLKNIEDIRLIVNGRIPVNFYGRQGGMIPDPEEILEVFKKTM